MVILMGKGSIEAKYGLIGLKGLMKNLRHVSLHTNVFDPF